MMKEDMWYLEIQKDLTYHIMKRKTISFCYCCFLGGKYGWRTRDQDSFNPWFCTFPLSLMQLVPDATVSFHNAWVIKDWYILCIVGPVMRMNPFLVLPVHCLAFNCILGKKHSQETNSKTVHIFLKIVLIIRFFSGWKIYCLSITEYTVQSEDKVVGFKASTGISAE